MNLKITSKHTSKQNGSERKRPVSRAKADDYKND
jgi:hypothetical protein